MTSLFLTDSWDFVLLDPRKIPLPVVTTIGNGHSHSTGSGSASGRDTPNMGSINNSPFSPASKIKLSVPVQPEKKNNANDVKSSYSQNEMLRALQKYTQTLIESAMNQHSFETERKFQLKKQEERAIWRRLQQDKEHYGAEDKRLSDKLDEIGKEMD